MLSSLLLVGFLFALVISFLTISSPSPSPSTKGLWVAVGKDTEQSGRLKWSTDGKIWNNSTGENFGTTGGANITDHFGNGVAYGNKLWVAAGKGSSGTIENLMWSSDGIQWNYSDATGKDFEVEGYGVAYGLVAGESGWVAVGDDGVPSSNDRILWSNDGKYWNSSAVGSGSTPFNVKAYGVAYGLVDGESGWVAVGDDGSEPNEGNIMYSTDGKTWYHSLIDGTPNSVFSSYGRGVAYGNGRWVAVGQDSDPVGSILYSTDGKRWSKSSSESVFANEGIGVAYGNNLWVAVGDTGGTGVNSIMYSNNGKKWFSSSTKGSSFSGAGSEGLGIAFGGV